MKTLICNNLPEFKSVATYWDELWLASNVSNPCARSATLASAIQHFYSDTGFLAVMVFEGNTAIAAMPLVKQKLNRLIDVYAVPNNEWGNWGELMIHPKFDNPRMYSQLSVAMLKATSCNLRLNNIDKSTRQWDQLLGAIEEGNRSSISSFAFHVGMVGHDHHWESFYPRLTSGFRKKLRKYRRLLESKGSVSFEHHFRFDKTNLERRVAAAFDVEQRSWKATEHSSVIGSEKYEFYLEQARLLAENDQLRISFLRLEDDIIAFEFGAIAKGTYYSWKIGYDAEYAPCAPGQVLAEFMTRTYHQQGDCRVQDTVGPVTQATAKWSTRYSTRHNVLISGSSLSAKIQFKVFEIARKLKVRLNVQAAEIEPTIFVRPAESGGHVTADPVHPVLV